MRNLTPSQTRRAIADFGIERSLLETFGFSDDALQHRYSFHRHKKHQLLSPQAGVLLVETSSALHVVSPSQAAWIPAGVRHATTIGNAPACSLFFPPPRYGSPVNELRIIHAPSLLRELLLYGATPFRRPGPVQQGLFDLLHFLCLEALTAAPAPHLPRPRSPMLLRSFEWLLSHLDSASVPAMARHVGLSERSLRRHFQRDMGITPERYLQQVRLTKAMQLLLDPANRDNITQIALSVGYQNHSAFTAAFRLFSGQSPSSFRSSASSIF